MKLSGELRLSYSLLCYCILEKLVEGASGNINISTSTDGQYYRELIKYEGVYTYDALRDDIINFLFVLRHPPLISIFQPLLQRGEGQHIPLKPAVYCDNSTVFCNFTLIMRVDSDTVPTHHVVAISRTGERILHTKFVINVREEMIPLRWNYVFFSRRGNDTLDLQAEAIGYPKPDEYTLVNSSGYLLYKCRVDRVSELIPLQESSDLILSARNRKNEEIHMNISLSNRVSHDGVKATNHMSKACYHWRRTVGISVSLTLIASVIVVAIGYVTVRKYLRSKYNTDLPPLSGVNMEADNLKCDHDLSYQPADVTHDYHNPHVNSTVPTSVPSHIIRPETNERALNIHNHIHLHPDDVHSRPYRLDSLISPRHAPPQPVPEVLVDSESLTSLNTSLDSSNNITNDEGMLDREEESLQTDLLLQSKGAQSILSLPTEPCMQTLKSV